MILDTIDGFRKRTFTNRQIEAIRSRANLNVGPDVAEHAGISVEALQQFVNYTRCPSAEVLWRLARRLKVFEKTTR